MRLPWQSVKEQRPTLHKTRRLANFSMFLAVDFMLSMVPGVSYIIWFQFLLFGLVYVLCGKKYIVWYIIIQIISSMPNLLARTSTAVTEVAKVSSSQVALPSWVITIADSFGEFIQSYAIELFIGAIIFEVFLMWFYYRFTIVAARKFLHKYQIQTL